MTCLLSAAICLAHLHRRLEHFAANGSAPAGSGCSPEPPSTRDSISRSSMMASSRLTCLSTMPRNRSDCSRSCRFSCKQRLDESLDRSDRRAQFVRHVGDEVAAHVLQMPQPRDIVQDDQCADLPVAARRAGRTVGVEPAVLVGA